MVSFAYFRVKLTIPGQELPEKKKLEVGSQHFENYAQQFAKQGMEKTEGANLNFNRSPQTQNS